MAYDITMEKELEKELEQLKSVNFREYKILNRKLDEMKAHAKVLENHQKQFNSFDKPLQKYKWIELNDKILVFTIDRNKSHIHIYEYLPKEEVFEST